MISILGFVLFPFKSFSVQLKCSVGAYDRNKFTILYFVCNPSALLVLIPETMSKLFPSIKNSHHLSIHINC